MGNPFQEQLLKAGLVNKKQLKKAKHDQRISSKKKKKGKKERDVNEQENLVLQEQKEHERRNRELNLKSAEEKHKREQLSQVAMMNMTMADVTEPFLKSVKMSENLIFL